MTTLNIPNTIKLTYLYENQLANGSYELWMIFEAPVLSIKRTLQDLLDEHQQEKTSISLKTICVILLPIIEALTGLHENELLHQNVKSTNIILDHDDRSVLADLGDWCLSINDKSNEAESRHYLSRSSQRH